MLVLSSHQAMRSAVQPGQGGLAAPRVVVIGNFDGVHLGHQALFAHARRCAKAVSVVAMTFWPHPARVLAAARGEEQLAIAATPLILGRQRRRERLAESGVDVLIEQPFDLSFAALSPTAFVDEVLIGSLGARWVVVGQDFTFGKGRTGTTELLRELLSRHGAEVSLLPAYTVRDPATGEHIVCSSTFVRREIQAGRPERAALVLGEDFELEGEVVHGAARGRTLGFPTANLKGEAELRPAVGIYAAWAELIGPAVSGDEVVSRQVIGRYPAAVSVGYNATFTAADATQPPLSVEAHLIQPQGAPPLPSLYGQTVRLHILRRLREELRFPSIEALVAQIHRDIDQTKVLLGVTW
jgi:riboflavin kinase/FMN adenylyltransferase